MTADKPRRDCRLELDNGTAYWSGGMISLDNQKVLLRYGVGDIRDPGGFDVFDAAGGKRLARWPGANSLNVTFSPDGRLFVWQERRHGNLLLGDLQSGKIYKELTTDLSHKPYRRAMFHGSNSPDHAQHLWRFDRLTVSSDDRQVAAVWNSTFAVSAHPQQSIDDQDKEPTTLYVWNVANGKETARIAFRATEGKMPQVTCLAFLRDGRTLAAGYLNDAGVHLIEIASGRERGVLAGHQGTVRSLALSPEGRYLLSGSDDTTILVWDVDQLPLASSRPDQQPLPTKEQSRLWNDLASTDAAVAFRAMQTLLHHPEAALTLLQERLQPIAEVKPERIEQWIAALDSDDFAVRERATKELERLGELAEPALRQVLAGRPSLEVRRRLEGVLEIVMALRSPLPPERLQQVRGVEVLEAIDTGAVRTQLEKLAGGAVGARLTREAKESLRRLSSRKEKAEKKKGHRRFS